MSAPPALEILMCLSVAKGLVSICPVVPEERTCLCSSVVFFLTSLACKDAALDCLETPSLLVGILAVVGRSRVSSQPHA